MGIIEKQSIQDIANAIRNRNGLTTLYKPREMDEAILNLYSTTKVNNMLDYILPCYEKEATSYTVQYADADRPGSISKLEGNTSQNGTPTPTSPVEVSTVSGDNEVVVVEKNFLNNTATTQTINGVTFTVNSDKSVTVNGTATAHSVFYLGSQTIPVGTYTLSGCPKNGAWSTYSLGYGNYNDSGNGSTFTLTSSLTTNPYIRIGNGTTVSNLTFYPQLEKGSQATTYSPYVGNNYRVDLGVENLIQNNMTSQTLNGITFTINEDKSIKVVGTATARTEPNLWTSANWTMKANTNYYNNSNTTIYLYGNYNGTDGYFVFNSGATYNREYDYIVNRVYIRVENGATVNTTYYPQVSLKKSTAYTPYGTTPIELCKIGNYVDKLKRAEGKNLLNNTATTQTISGVTFTVNNSGTISLSGTSTSAIEIPLGICSLNNGSYIGNCASNSSTSSYYIRLGTNNTSSSGWLANITHNTTFSLNTNTNVYVLLIIKNGVNVNNVTIYPMINLGSTALPYEPYGNNWYIEKNIGKVVLNGSETWTRTAKGSNYVFWSLYTTLGIPVGRYEANSKLCDYFPYEFKTWIDSTINHLAENGSSSLSILFNVDTSIATTVEQWNSWLSTHNTTVYYALATPTYEIITNENLIEQLNNIQDMQLIENLCHIDWVGIESPTMKLFCYLDKDKIIEEITD